MTTGTLAVHTLLVGALLAAGPKARPEGGIHLQWTERTRAFVAALNARDQKALAAMLDPVRLVVMGPDTGDQCTDVACVDRLTADLFGLWGARRFDEPRRLRVESSASLTNVLFDLSMGGGDAAAAGAGGASPPGLTYRVVMTWVLTGKEWRLAQWLFFEPTSGASLRERALEDLLE